MSAGTLDFQQLRVSEELAALRKSREGLQQQEVNTIESDKARKQPATRARVRGSALRSASAAYEGGKPALSKPIINEITTLKPKTNTATTKLQFEGTDIDIIEGQRLTVKNDVNVIREEANGIIDRTKELYCGERGKVSKIYNMLDSCGVDISFPDGETRFFTLRCLEPPVPPKKAAPLPRVAAIPKEKDAAEKPPTTPSAATQKVKSVKPATQQPAKTATAPAAATAAAKPASVGDVISITLGGKVVPNCTIRFVGTTEFAPGSWVGLELPTPDGKNNGTVAGVSYFQCNDNFGLFRREAELQGANTNKDKSDSASAPKKPAPKRPVKSIARSATPSFQCSTKTVRLWENGQYGSTIDTVPFKGMVIRSVHKTLKSVLNTATRELGWHILKRSVDILYLEDGTEVTDLGQIRDGANVVASWGDSFVFPDSPLPKQKSSKPAPAHEDPSVTVGSGASTPTGSKYGVPVSSTPTPQKSVSAARKTTSTSHKTVKVFENGCYGSSWSDTIPSYTVTIRPNFKTTSSIMTMIAREMSWNKQGRKVDLIFDTLGEEITDPSVISNGDTIIASAGDNFIKPHSDVQDRLPPPAVKAAQVEAQLQQEAQSRVKSASPAPKAQLAKQPDLVRSSDSSSPARRFLQELQQEMTAEEEAYMKTMDLSVSSDMSCSSSEEEPGAKPKSNMDRIAQLMAEIAELES